MVRRDKALFVDCEMTCWENGVPPEGMRQEIISIGVIEIHTAPQTIIREAEYFIKPKDSMLSDFCTELTGITPEILKQKGRPFPEVMRTLAKNFGSNKLWMAWGGDRDVLLNEAEHHGTEMPFSRDYINLSALFGIMLGTEEKLSLDKALQRFDLQFEGRRHGALVDARNLAYLWLEASRMLRDAADLEPSTLQP